MASSEEHLQGDLSADLGAGLVDVNGRKPTSFEEYWLASKEWQRRGLTLASARALASAGILTLEDFKPRIPLNLR